MYHRHTYFRASQIYAIFAIRPQFAKIGTHEIFVSRVYPHQIWHLEVLFAVPLYYGTSASLQEGQRTPS